MRLKQTSARAALILGLITATAAHAQTATPLPAPSTCDWQSVDSPPGKAWWAQERWRYASDADATAAYQALANGQSPWPNWYQPPLPAVPLAVLAVGTRFQMALAPGQAETSPGGWGTFDNIATVADAREFLAITIGFKPQIDRVVTYEVTRMLPVTIGPVGPQVDRGTCRLLPGRWSQFNMLPAWNQRMDYLKVVEVRAIQ